MINEALMFLRSWSLNIGPHHPSTHGVLRIISFVEGETVKWLIPEIGLLHRGTEKLVEYRSLNQGLG